MKKFLVITLCMLFATTASLAQKPEPQKTETKPEAKKPEAKAETKPALPTAEQILDKYEKASGSKIRGTKIMSMVTKGVIEIPAQNMKGVIESFSKNPNKSLIVTTIPGYGTASEGYDGQIAWAQDPTSGLRQKKGEELIQAKRAADFGGNLRSQYSKFELKGMEKVGEKDTYVIVGMTSEGKPETFYFDTQTGMLLRQDTMYVSAMGEFPVKSFLEDYKEFEGIMMAYTTRQIVAGSTIIMKVEEVKTNVAIDDAKFAMPKPQ